jgi:hypothetical protein
MTNGVLIFKGMKVGFLAGDLQISIDDAGSRKSTAILSSAYNVLPIWLRVAHDNLNQAKRASDAIVTKWDKAIDDERKELLISELTTSLQVFISCGIVLDALYDQLYPYAKISDSDRNAWTKNKTGRAKQIAEVIRRAYKLDNKIFKKFRQNICEIIKYRDLAVHPSNELKNTCPRPDIPVGVDWKFSIYRFPNSERCYVAIIEMFEYLYKKKGDNKHVIKLTETIFEALRELMLIKKEFET